MRIIHTKRIKIKDTMKKHLFKTIFLLCELLTLSSCLKDDPKHNPTIYYAYQQIPNINEFMPQRLLYAFGNENLHFGDEPPKIEGTFVADHIAITQVQTVPSSHWMQTATSIPTPQYFNFYDQHKGIAKMRFKYPKGSPGDYTYFLENSSTDTTYALVKNDLGRFTNDTIAPTYFKQGKHNIDDFNTVYIIGNAPYFTIFYYEIRNISSKAEPLNAIIISGKMDKEIKLVNDTVTHTIDTIVKPVIRDLKWGIETMKYYKESTSINQIINFGFLPTPGDLVVIKNDGVAHSGEF